MVTLGILRFWGATRTHGTTFDSGPEGCVNDRRLQFRNRPFIYSFGPGFHAPFFTPHMVFFSSGP